MGSQHETYVPAGAAACYLVPTNHAVGVNSPSASPPWNEWAVHYSARAGTLLAIGYAHLINVAEKSIDQGDTGLTIWGGTD